MMTFSTRRLLRRRCSSPAVALVRPPRPQPTTKERAAGFGSFGSSKEPIKIDADKLDVFDKEGRAVFAGNVVAVQGDSTMNCTLMTVFVRAEARPAAPGAPAAATGRDGLRRQLDQEDRLQGPGHHRVARRRSRPATTPPSTASPTRSS